LKTNIKSLHRDEPLATATAAATGGAADISGGEPRRPIQHQPEVGEREKKLIV
jgi:hypothetical protein